MGLAPRRPPPGRRREAAGDPGHDARPGDRLVQGRRALLARRRHGAGRRLPGRRPDRQGQGPDRALLARQGVRSRRAAADAGALRHLSDRRRSHSPHRHAALRPAGSCGARHDGPAARRPAGAGPGAHGLSRRLGQRRLGGPARAGQPRQRPGPGVRAGALPAQAQADRPGAVPDPEPAQDRPQRRRRRRHLARAPRPDRRRPDRARLPLRLSRGRRERPAAGRRLRRGRVLCGLAGPDQAEGPQGRRRPLRPYPAGRLLAHHPEPGAVLARPRGRGHGRSDRRQGPVFPGRRVRDDLLWPARRRARGHG